MATECWQWQIIWKGAFQDIRSMVNTVPYGYISRPLLLGSIHKFHEAMFARDILFLYPIAKQPISTKQTSGTMKLRAMEAVSAM